MLIYCIMNTVNGKKYIGKTTGSIEKRWKEHLKWARRNSSMPIHLAINKHGPETFLRREVIKAACIEELNEFEKFFIFLNNSRVPFGYNILPGGEGGALKGHIVSEETREKISNTKKGIPMPEEQKRKLSEIMKGRKLSEEHRKGISEGSYRPHTQETKDKISATKLARAKPRITHCIHGHPFDEKNTRFDRWGYQVCRACARIAARKKRGQLELSSLDHI